MNIPILSLQILLVHPEKKKAGVNNYMHAETSEDISTRYVSYFIILQSCVTLSQRSISHNRFCKLKWFLTLLTTTSFLMASLRACLFSHFLVLSVVDNSPHLLSLLLFPQLLEVPKNIKMCRFLAQIPLCDLSNNNDNDITV